MALKLLSDDATITVRDADLADVPDGDPDVTYTIRPVTREVMKDIVKARTTRQVDPSSRRMVDVLDKAGSDEDALDYALVAWDGILFNGDPAPCDRAMKLKLDPFRVSAIMEIAIRTQRAEEDRAASFRATA